MAEVLFHPVTGDCLHAKLDSEVGRDGESKRWGRLESTWCGIALVPDAELEGKQLKEYKVDVTQLTAKQKADIADQKKVAKITVGITQKAK